MNHIHGMVGVIDPSDILIGPRERKVYNGIVELAEDMKTNGVISPLAVRPARENEEGYDPEQGKKFWLIAGGRRIKAIRLAGFTQIPVRVYPSSITPMEELDIEMQENLQREDLTWQERTQGLAKLHQLKIAIHGEKVSSSRYDEGWSQKDTAAILGVAPAKVSQDLALASAMNEIPELAKCKTADEARKLLQSTTRKMIEAEIVKRHIEKKDNTPESIQRKKLIQSYILGDTFEKIREVPTASIDFIDLDPPYGIKFNTLFDSGTNENSFQADNVDFTDIDCDEYPLFILAILKECFRVLKPTGWIAVWHSIWLEEVTYLAMKEAGFTCNRGPALWIKPGKVGRVNSPYTMFTLDYEPFLYGHKGMGELRKPGRSSLFNHRPSRNKFHPTSKPILLMEEVLMTFSDPGSQVLVPFLGSGNTLLACNNTGRHGMGFDIAEPFKNSFAVRVLRGVMTNFRDDETVEEEEDATDTNS